MVLNQGLIEDYDRQAELLRQTRDDESKSIDERIKANEKLAKVLDEQEKAMLSNASISVQRAKVELDKNKESIELQKAFQEALNEQAGIEAQITGFRSEQQTNANALLREQKDIQNELALIGKSERDIQRTELLQQYDLQKELIDRQVADETEKNNLLLEAKRVYDEQLLELNTQFDEEDLANKKAVSDAAVDIAKKESDAKQENLAKVGNALSSFSELAGKETAAGKALAIASTLIQTYQSAQSSYASLAGIPVVGPALGVAAAGAAVFAGMKQIQNIKKTKVPGGGGGASAGGGASVGAAPAPPSFNVVGASETSALGDAVASQTNEPVQAYVVSNDVTTAQSLQNNIVEGATI